MYLKPLAKNDKDAQNYHRKCHNEIEIGRSVGRKQSVDIPENYCGKGTQDNKTYKSAQGKQEANSQARAPARFCGSDVG